MSARPWPFFVVLAIASVAADAAANPRQARGAAVFAIRWNHGGGATPAAVDVIGIDPANLAALSRPDWSGDRWPSLFAVWVEPSTAAAKGEPTPILGSYRVIGDALRFTPRFPIEPGLLHRARFRPARLPLPLPEGASLAEISGEQTLPRPEPPAPTFVARVDPAGDRLPENLLKFYLHFSAPMRRGEAYDRVRLLDATGRPLIAPFLEIGEELWDSSGTRLTLLLDPGRIKRGLKPREEDGPILEAGKSYIVVVDRDWPDARGYPLRERFRKSFRAGHSDDSQPDPKTWTVEAPAAGSRGFLSLTFPEPLDRAMLDRCLVVHDTAGRAIGGRVEVNAEATRWKFRPDEAWTPASYRVAVDTELEDLAGNSIARPFEVDVQRPIDDVLKAESVDVPLTVRP